MLNWGRSLKSAKGKGQINHSNHCQIGHKNSTKHLNYFTNIMTEYRFAKYLLVAEDASAVLRYSTEQICTCISLWKGDVFSDAHYLLKDQDDDELTEFGIQIIRIGEILGGILNKNPIAFWTSKDREAILQVIIPMAKDAAKLKRKLVRISDGMITDVSKLRKLADIHGLLCGGPDPVQSYQDISAYNEASVLELGIDLPCNFDKTPPDPRCFKSVVQFLRSIFANKKNPQHTENVSTDPTNDEDTEASKLSKNRLNEGFSLRSMDLRTPSENPSEKHLQKIVSALATPKNLGSLHCIYDSQDIKLKSEDPTSMELEARQWKSLELDHCKTSKSLETKISPIICTDIEESELKNIVDEHAKNYFPLKSDNASQQPDQDIWSTKVTGQSKKEAEEHVKQASSGNHNENFVNTADQLEADILDDSEKHLESIGISKKLLLTSTPQEEFPDFDNNPYKLLPKSQDHSESVAKCTSIVNEMHQSILEITEQIRAVEKFWLTLKVPNKSNKSGKNHGFKKLKDLLVFVRQTVHLLEDRDFEKQLYPETRRCLIQALDPVYKESHSCFIALGELVQMVSTDVSYLRELLENFPKGDPIVYEYCSNSNLDSLDPSVQATNSQPFLAPPLHNYNYLDLDAIFG